MLSLYRSPLRAAVQQVITLVQDDLLIACPFIRATEADWVCNQLLARGLGTSVRVQILTDIRADTVLRGALEIGALSMFAEALANTVLINLPRVHAKVYVADNNFALVTSANLTFSGLESNFEYGVGMGERAVVQEVRNDLHAYARLGNVLNTDDLRELGRRADELNDEFQRTQASAASDARNRFEETLRSTRIDFLRAQVGRRTANSLFSEAIVYALSRGPLPTSEIHSRVKELLPDLCDDSEELVINGERYGKRWKHAVRNAQQSLKREAMIAFTGRVWKLQK